MTREEGWGLTGTATVDFPGDRGTRRIEELEPVITDNLTVGWVGGSGVNQVYRGATEGFIHQPQGIGADSAEAGADTQRIGRDITVVEIVVNENRSMSGCRSAADNSQ